MGARVAIPGSEAHHISGGHWLPVEADEQISPTIVIRRSKRTGELSQALLAGSSPERSREEAEELLRVDPEDLAAVESFLRGYGLTIVDENADARTVRVNGSAMRIGQAFGVEIEWRVDTAGNKFLSYKGALMVPAALAGVVEAVLGLDQRPIARRGAGA